jgi:predicted DNA-binding transcriptional regulator AlpA
MSKKTTPTRAQSVKPHTEEVNALLDVITNGCGEELLTVNQLKATGSHPFSNSTRRRKIKNNEYPKPIKISPQMSLWKAGDIRRWRQDPNGYSSTKGEKA